MSDHSILYSVNYQTQSSILWSADKVLIPLSVAWTGRTTVEGKTYHFAIRILAGLAALVIAPLTLLALAVKWSKIPTTPVETIQPSPPVEIETPVVPMTKEEITEKICAEMKRVQELDPKLGEPVKGSWRAFGARAGETNQTLDMYIEEKSTTLLPDQRPLHVQRIGTLTEVDLKIINITCDFLKVMHGIPIQMQESTITMDWFKQNHIEKIKQKHQEKIKNVTNPSSLENYESKLKTEVSNLENTLKTRFPRGNGQYEGEQALIYMYDQLQPLLKTGEDDTPQLIAFTSDDLYTNDMQNFVFGVAFLSLGVGIWSKARLGDPAQSSEAFEKCLLRMMKIASHEFGHMRGIPHCTDYECNIGGYMSMKEVDSRPLLYCAQDTAKVCYLGQTTVLEHERKLLEFFENFNTKYQLQCDLSKEIGKLKARIAKLEQSAV